MLAPGDGGAVAVLGLAVTDVTCAPDGLLMPLVPLEQAAIGISRAAISNAIHLRLLNSPIRTPSERQNSTFRVAHPEEAKDLDQLGPWHP